MELVCDDKRVQKEVAGLHDVCEAEGAIFHDKLRMFVDQGDIWLESKLPADNRDTLISLPESCLPDIGAVNFKLHGDDIEIESIQPGRLSNTQERCLKHMLAIYNATGKTRQHRETSPWFALAETPELLAYLVSSRQGAPKIESLHKRLQEEGPTDAFIIDSFLGTRKYGALSNQVLMPFIDYANHHSHAPGFQSRPEKAPDNHRVSLCNGKPLDDSDEIRVRYSALDALDAFLSYGFVDKSADIVRSVPSTLKSGEVAIEVNSRIGVTNKKPLQKEIANLRPYMPQILDDTGDKLQISHLLFPPSGSALALRRILNWLVRMHDPDIGLIRLRRYVKEFEEDLLTRNKEFYDTLETKVQDSQDAIPEIQAGFLRTLIEHQREALNAYESRLQPAEGAR